MKVIILNNFDLIFVGIAMMGIGILGFIIFVNNYKSISNRNFFYLSVAVIVWSFLNYLSYRFNDPIVTLWLMRGVLFSAVWFAFFIFQFLYTFPQENISFPKIYKFLIIPLVFLVAVFTLSPFVFTDIQEMPLGDRIVPKAIVAPGILIFGITISLLNISGIILLFRKWLNAKGIEKNQYSLVLLGLTITIALIIIFNFIFPVFLDNQTFIIFGAFFIFPFLAFTAYDILKHKLFNIKVITTELLVFVIWTVILLAVLTKESWREIVVEGGILLFVIIFGIFLIRSVRREVKRREEFELLSKDLGAANEKLKELDQMKTDFISIASHQLRTPLTAIKGYSSMILEGVYGESPIQMRGAVDKIFQSAQRLIYIVNDLLDTSRIEQGRFQLSIDKVETGNVLMGVIEELKPMATNKNIELSLEMSPDDADVVINGDQNKLRQVLVNLIDNAIKYTEKGYVKVSLRKIPGDHLLISVKDTGVGISSQAMKNLFQKFSRAKNVSKFHVDGSGLGLYIAKQIIDAHNGRIWAESAGEGKGSQFYVELPIAA